MGLFRRRWMKQHHDQASFDLIDLNQFKSSSCRYLFGYILMYITILISFAVYGSDIYTAVMLLALNRWSSGIDPYVPFKISKWLFAGCIILSLLLLIYEFIRAWSIMKSKNVAMNYSTPIARNLYSIYGYRYFCLFAKITKSRSKTEYLALFVYFTFKGWIRLIFADSPRQVLNALTLYSVVKLDHEFLDSIKKIADKSLTEAIVLGFMTFSLFIWVISIVQFIIALLCAFPLYVHIDKTCSGLEEYCCVRINRRISHLVQKHHKKGLMELKEANKRLPKQPTLPTVVLDNDEQTDESFEDILGAQGKSTKKYLAYKKDTDFSDSQSDLYRHGSNSTTATASSRTGYGYMEPTDNPSQSLLHHQPTPQSSFGSLRSQPSNGSIQYYPGPPSRSGSNASNSSQYTGGGAGRPVARMPSLEEASPVQPTSGSILQNGSRQQPPGAVRFAGQPPGPPVRTVGNQQVPQVVQQRSPEAALPPKSVTFDQSTPQSPAFPPGAMQQQQQQRPMPQQQYAAQPYHSSPYYPNNQPRGPPPPPQQQQQQLQGPPGSRPVLTPIRTDLAQARAGGGANNNNNTNNRPLYHPNPPANNRQPPAGQVNYNNNNAPIRPPSASSSIYQDTTTTSGPPPPMPVASPENLQFYNSMQGVLNTPSTNSVQSPPSSQQAQKSHLSFSRPMPEPTLPNFDVDSPTNETSNAGAPPPPQSSQSQPQRHNSVLSPTAQSHRQPTLPKFDDVYD